MPASVRLVLVTQVPSVGRASHRDFGFQRISAHGAPCGDAWASRRSTSGEGHAIVGPDDPRHAAIAVEAGRDRSVEAMAVHPVARAAADPGVRAPAAAATPAGQGVSCAPGWWRRTSSRAAMIGGGVRCGQCAGRRDRSTSPAGASPLTSVTLLPGPHRLEAEVRPGPGTGCSPRSPPGGGHGRIRIDRTGTARSSSCSNPGDSPPRDRTARPA